MRPIATDAAWSVCLLFTTTSFTKTTEPIEVPFGIWTRVKESFTRWRPGLPNGSGSLKVWTRVKESFTSWGLGFPTGSGSLEGGKVL